MACLDTSILLDLRGRGGRRRRSQAEALIAQLLSEGEQLVTTRFNVAELWVGVERSNDPAAEEEIIEEVLEGVAVLEFDGDCARQYGRSTADLQRQGLPCGDLDVLIAAVAIVNGHSIVTTNRNHFEPIADLTVRVP